MTFVQMRRIGEPKMAFKETEQLWNRGCEKERGAKDDDRTAHSDTKYRQSYAQSGL